MAWKSRAFAYFGYQKLSVHAQPCHANLDIGDSGEILNIESLVSANGKATLTVLTAFGFEK